MQVQPPAADAGQPGHSGAYGRRFHHLGRGLQCLQGQTYHRPQHKGGHQQRSAYQHSGRRRAFLDGPVLCLIAAAGFRLRRPPQGTAAHGAGGSQRPQPAHGQQQPAGRGDVAARQQQEHRRRQQKQIQQQNVGPAQRGQRQQARQRQGGQRQKQPQLGRGAARCGSKICVKTLI